MLQMSRKRLKKFMGMDNSDLSSKETLIFDCDGVILNSNKIKTEAFFQAALPYGEGAARCLVDYHIKKGGVSRYKKFEYFLSHIVTEGSYGPSLTELLESYAAFVRSGLANCEVARGLHELRQLTLNARWMIVSGGDQEELRDVFAERELDHFFDGGIFGSPASKESILACGLSEGVIRRPFIFFGDSRYDYDAAMKFDIPFVFVADWSEWKEGRDFLGTKCSIINSLGDLVLPG